MDAAARERKAFQEIEREQCGEALRRRRRLVHGHAAVRRGQGLAPLASVTREIVFREKALGRHVGCDRPTHAARIEEVGPLGREVAERAREITLDQELAVRGDAAVRREDTQPFGRRLLRNEVADPLAQQ